MPGALNIGAVTVVIPRHEARLLSLFLVHLAPSPVMTVQWQAALAVGDRPNIKGLTLTSI